MSDKTLTRLGAGFTLLLLLHYTLGGPFIRSLPYNAGDVDHADPATLLLMHDVMPRSLIAAVMGLVGPTLATLASLGWSVPLRPAGPIALRGVRVFQVGMLFVLLQDTIELFADATLPGAYAGASVEALPAVLQQGAFYNQAIDSITLIAFTICVVGTAMYGWALVQLRGAWRALGAFALVAAAAMAASISLNLIGHSAAFQSMVVSILLQVVWSLLLGVMMLVWSLRRNSTATASA